MTEEWHHRKLLQPGHYSRAPLRDAQVAQSASEDTLLLHCLALMESDTRDCNQAPAAARTQALQVDLAIDTEAARIHPTTRMEAAAPAVGTKPLDQSFELVP